MNSSRAAWCTLVVVAALALTGTRARAQSGSTEPGFQTSVEAYVAQYALDRDNNTSATSVHGFGARIMFNRPDERGRSVFDRASSALFVTVTGDQGTPPGKTLHVGGELDAAFFRRPLGHVLDPFFSLGVGIFRTSRDLPTSTGGRDRLRRSDLALTPGLGTRIALVHGVGLRGDVKAPFVFGFRTSANAVAEGGLYVSF